ncbi:MAG: hypothetical protein GXP62_12785 [Oligoflexia bacterium]|nr:hypothetical protein [Oligoflexia bacterium]
MPLPHIGCDTRPWDAGPPPPCRLMGGGRLRRLLGRPDCTDFGPKLIGATHGNLVDCQQHRINGETGTRAGWLVHGIFGLLGAVGADDASFGTTNSRYITAGCLSDGSDGPGEAPMDFGADPVYGRTGRFSGRHNFGADPWT